MWLKINGGSMWESNPPRMLLTPRAGFEVMYTCTFILSIIIYTPAKHSKHQLL